MPKAGNTYTALVARISGGDCGIDSNCIVGNTISYFRVRLDRAYNSGNTLAQHTLCSIILDVSKNRISRIREGGITTI